MKAYILMFAIATFFLLASLPVAEAITWPQDINPTLNKVGKTILKQGTKRLCKWSMGGMAGVFGLAMKPLAWEFEYVAGEMDGLMGGYTSGGTSAGCPAPGCVDTCMDNGGSFGDCMDACE